MFEKYDGIRAFWNPEKKAFLSRFGKTFNIPSDFISAMPTIFLDGELWYGSSCYLWLPIPSLLTPFRFGEDSFQEAMKLSHRTDMSRIDWNRFRYMVFDIPNGPGTYEERYSVLGN